MKHLIRILTVIAFVVTGSEGTAIASARDPKPELDTWNIDSGEIDPARYFGVTVANGMIGILSAPAPFRAQQVLINGAYETFLPGYVGCTVSSFDFLNVNFTIDGERIERLNQVSRFRQQLRMKDAAFTTSFDVGDKASIKYTVRALRQLPYTALLEITVAAKRPITIAPTTLLPAPHMLTDVHSYDSASELRSNPRIMLDLRAAVANTQYKSHTVAAVQTFIFDEPHSAAPTVEQRKEGLAFIRKLAAGDTYRFSVVGSTVTSAHAKDPLNHARRLTVFAAVQGARQLIAQHEREWRELWKSDILIEGDDETQRDVHGMLYHLYSFIREGTGYSISPMGLSRGDTGYLGHIFWDAEMWMFPALLALKPALAKTMLDYRYDRLAAAKRNAIAYGYRGAMFPWESADSGDEETPSGAVSGPAPIHINGDIAVAAWNYYRVTQDEVWLREKGYPLIKETADFWTSRVARNAPGRYDINYVIGADEHAGNVDNNAFTNAVARENLTAATAAAKVLKLAPDPDWDHVRKNIPILVFPNGVIREHASYDGEQIKQADVNLLAYPLKVVTDPQAIRRDLDYYGDRADHLGGPAMTKSILAVLYHRLGMVEKARNVFHAGYQPNKRPPFGVIAESATSSNPYFATGAGGLLQTMLFGFGGLDITAEGLMHSPTQLPTAWKSLTLTGIGPQARTYVVKSDRAHLEESY